MDSQRLLNRAKIRIATRLVKIAIGIHPMCHLLLPPKVAATEKAIKELFAILPAGFTVEIYREKA